MSGVIVSMCGAVFGVLLGPVRVARAVLGRRMDRRTTSVVTGRGLAISAWMIGLLAAWVAPAFAAESGDDSSRAVIRTYEQLWQAGQSGKSAEQPAHARLFVMCYYADWKALWVLWGGEVHYLDAGPQPLPLRDGAWYDVDGLVLPARQTFDWRRTKLIPVEALPAPVPVMLQADASNLEVAAAHYAEISGVVDQQSDLDNRHFSLHVVFGGTSATVYVAVGARDATPQLTGTIIRARGVLSVKRDVNDVAPKLEFWCASPRSIESVGFLADDPRFSVPITPIEKVVVRSDAERVHVAGTVYRQDPGSFLILRDDSGQIKVLTQQQMPVGEGDAVEAIGIAARDGVALTLRQGLFRRRSAESRTNTARLMLRLAEQVRTLNPADIRSDLEAQIGGVVTWSSPNSPYFFLEDATGGVKVLRPASAEMVVPVIGAGVLVRGKVVAGNFAPVVKATAVSPGDNVAMPEPQAISWEQAMTGASYGSWVEMQGYVRSMARSPAECRIEMIASGGEFSAVLPTYDGADLTGAIIRVRGICDVRTNERRQLVGVRLLVSGSEYVQVVEPAPADPFATPVESIGNLRRYNSTTPLNRRVQVTGVVLLQIPGRLLYLQDGSDTLMVLCRQFDSLTPGDRIAVVGIPGQDGGRLVMREAKYRRVGRGAPPLPIALTNLVPNPEIDGTLVRVRGSLLSREPTPDGVRLQLQHANSIFTAQLETGAARLQYEIGSTLELTGVYRVQLDEYQQPRGFVVNLRSPGDVAVLARPAWWTPARVLWLATALLGLVLLASGWAVLLTRKNEQLRRAQRELQRANEELETRVAERTRDLTDEVEHRRESEQALASERLLLRTLIDNLPAYLYVKDAAGRFVIGNLPHARLLGAKDAAEIIGKTERDFWPADLAAEHEHSDRVVMTTGEPFIQHEETYGRGDNRRWHAVTKVPLRDSTGRITGLIAIIQDISARKEVEADRESLHRKLLETSRHAGMAEVATGVLHNIGNVLNSVNISAGVAAEIVARSRIDKLAVVTDLFAKHRADLGTFFSQDPRAARIPDYLEALSEQLRSEHAEVSKELGSLQSNIDHIKQVVAMQQAYAKISGVTEKIAVQEIVEDALRINGEGLARHRIQVVRDLRVNPTIVIERHKVLQILVNLISNAKYACDDAGHDTKQVTVTVEQRDSAVQIGVSDNGVGIRPENLTRIFSHGFTTRKNGHGFGLHSGAIVAKELGGALRVSSEGPGCGATFTLELPVRPDRAA